MKSFFRMSYPYILWIGIFIVAPMLMIFLYAITKAGNSTLTFQFTLDNFTRFFRDPDFIRVLLTSLRIAFLTTVFCLLIGYPAALFMANLSDRMQTLVTLLLTLPMWINMLLKTYAWRGILLNFDFSSELRVFIGMVYDFLPFMIIQIHTAIAKLDPNLLVAAHDLGANRVKSFLKVKMLGGGDYVLIGNLIETHMLVIGDWNYGSAISLIMALIIIAAMWATKKLDRSAQED